MNQSTKLDRLVGIAELSEILGVPRSWCYRHLHDHFTVIRCGKYVRVKLSEVAAFIEAGGTDDQ